MWNSIASIADHFLSALKHPSRVPRSLSALYSTVPDPLLNLIAPSIDLGCLESWLYFVCFDNFFFFIFCFVLFFVLFCFFFLLFEFYRLSRLFHSFEPSQSVGGAKKRSPRKTTRPPTSRHLLVSHVTRARLEHTAMR